jgi:hypothetical protein
MNLLYVKLTVLGVGILCSSVSGCFLMRSANEVQTPLPLDLAAMEAGGEPPSRYVRLTDYVVRVEETFIKERVTPQKGGGEVRISDFFFPAVSKTNPAADPKQPLTSFVLVICPRGNALGPDKKVRPPTGALEGALAIGLDAIEGEEISFLQKEYPGLDVSRIRVLIPGEKPWTGINGWIWLTFGIVTTAIGGYLLATGEQK